MQTRSGFVRVVTVVLVLLGAQASTSAGTLTPPVADYVVLCPPSLYNAALSFAEHRAIANNLRPYVYDTDWLAENFGGVDDNAIRAFVTWLVAADVIAPTYLLLIGDADPGVPEYDLVPTHLEPSDWWFGDDHSYATDSWFVRPVDDLHKKPVMHIGRIPARTADDITRYMDKVTTYDAMPGQPAWLQKLLMLVGDRNEGTNNEHMRMYADELWNTDLANWGERTILYSSVYPSEGWPGNATADTWSAWNAGYGVVNAFGNTDSREDLVYMAAFHLSTPPTFTQSLNATNMCPLVIDGSCLGNYFYRDTPGGSIGEDLLMKESTKGAIGIIGPSHKSLAMETFRFNRLLLDGIQSKGIRYLGQLLTYARVGFEQGPLGQDFVQQQFCLLGDPALRLRVPTEASVEWRSGFEIEDDPVRQDTYIGHSNGLSSPSARVVMTMSGSGPVSGDRFYKVKIRDYTPGSRDWIEWKIADVGHLITRNTVLAFRLRVNSSPGDLGHVSVDGSTARGPLRNEIEVVDQNGARLNAIARPPAAAGIYNLFYVDLSPLEGYSLDDLRIRYEAAGAAEQGSLDADVDDIWIAPANPQDAQDEAIDGDCEVDDDGDDLPDFWVSIPGVQGESDLYLTTDNPWSGSKCLLIGDRYCTGQGASQIIHTDSDAGMYTVTCMARSWADNQLIIRVTDAVTGTVLAQEAGPLSTEWSQCTAAFNNPYPYGWGRVRLDLVPSDCSASVYVDAVQMRKSDVVETSPTAKQNPSAIACYPNPAKQGDVIKFRLPPSSRGEATGVVYDVAGRQVAGVELGKVTEHSSELFFRSGGAGGHALSPGSYWVVLRLNGKVMGRVRLTIL